MYGCRITTTITEQSNHPPKKFLLTILLQSYSPPLLTSHLLFTGSFTFSGMSYKYGSAQLFSLASLFSIMYNVYESHMRVFLYVSIVYSFFQLGSIPCINVPLFIHLLFEEHREYFLFLVIMIKAAIHRFLCYHRFLFYSGKQKWNCQDTW